MPSRSRYEPITREDFRTSVLEVIYGPNEEKSVGTAHAHRLSLFFIVLANGCLFHEDPGTVPCGKVYEALARASFSLGSILTEASVATVQTLFLLVRFIYSADRDRNEERWLLTGLNCRIANMVSPRSPRRTAVLDYFADWSSYVTTKFTW